jgi:hypothetical protein
MIVKKVKITNCNDISSAAWYIDKISQEFYVTEDFKSGLTKGVDTDHYQVIAVDDDARTFTPTDYILKSNCIVLREKIDISFKQKKSYEIVETVIKTPLYKLVLQLKDRKSYFVVSTCHYASIEEYNDKSEEYTAGYTALSIIPESAILVY